MGVADNTFQISSLDQGSTFYDWFNKTTSEFRDSDFLKLYLSVDREELIKRINKRTRRI